MQTANRITLLTLTAHLLGEERTIHPVLIQDHHDTVLIDAGYPGQLPLLTDALAQAGTAPEQLTAILITHHDIDHIGGLPDLLQAAPPSIAVLAHELERPYIQGEQLLLKFSGSAMAQLDLMPPALSAPLKRLIANPPKASVTATVTHGQTLPFAGGLTVIDTPGHTPGHISLYHPASRTLIAGDALLVEDGQLLISPAALSSDYEQAVRSVRNLAGYDIHTVLCYHGGRYEGNAAKRLNELAAEVTQ